MKKNTHSLFVKRENTIVIPKGDIQWPIFSKGLRIF